MNLPAQTNSTARAGLFSRGTFSNATYQSFVIPLDGEKGLALDLLSGNGLTLFPSNKWSTLYHTGISWVLFNNPIVAFGSRIGGSPLYVNQSYSFGLYAGAQGTGVNKQAADIQIQVYQKSTLAGVGTVNISIPQPGSQEWDAFAANGYTQTIDQLGLKTIVSRTVGTRWGAGSDSYILSHVSVRSDYLYEVDCVGFVTYSNGAVEGMVLGDFSTRKAAPSRLYTLEFEERPPWRSTFIDQPHFTGKPVPPSYQGKSLEELLAVSATVPGLPSLIPNAYLAIDASPELRRHPILDKFVTDMRNDPIALANYVLNEIGLTDAMDYNDGGVATDQAVNLGGIKRGALATFQEGQGSPSEQCALLVYLLRQAGVPALYASAPTNGLKMLDARLSTLLRLQVRDALNSLGQAANVPKLVPVNYPWVSAWIASENRWVHIFPWLKDTELTEGLDLYSHLPDAYNSGYKWVKKYLESDPAIMSLSADSDQPMVLFPKFIEKSLKDNYPGVSLDDIGVKAFDRRHLYARWDDFPKPFSINGALSVRESCKDLPNIFDTIQVEVYSAANPAKKIDTGELRIVDIHNRKMLLRFEKTGNGQHNMILTLEPYRPGVNGVVTFEPAADPLAKHSATTGLDASDDNVKFKTTLRRHKTLPSNDSPWWLNFMEVAHQRVEVTEHRSVRKGDLATFVFNVGGVSQRMLRTHAEEFWQFERDMAANPN